MTIENYSEHDEFLMKAKINFNSVVVGKNENVLHFIGAVVSETNSKLFVNTLCKNNYA
jgi:hypothetical protein